MPELPEVETVRRALEHLILGQTIESVDVFWAPALKNEPVAKFKTLLANQTITGLERKAKYLIIKLTDRVLISHLRMEGRYFYQAKSAPIDWKHVLVNFHLQNGYDLRYFDTRKFGTFWIKSLTDYLITPPLSLLGYEPNDPRLTAAYLHQAWAHKTQALKTTLLDQHVISGIGNIYADEILFCAQLSPFTAPKTLTLTDLNRLLACARKIMTAATKAGGTTIFSFTHPSADGGHGISGKFQTQLKVHRREGQPCFHCQTPIIKVKLNGRGTYYCPICQKQP